MDRSASLNDVERTKILPLPRLELFPFVRPACSHLLYRLHCHSSSSMGSDLKDHVWPIMPHRFWPSLTLFWKLGFVYCFAQCNLEGSWKSANCAHVSLIFQCPRNFNWGLILWCSSITIWHNKKRLDLEYTTCFLISILEPFAISWDSTLVGGIMLNNKMTAQSRALTSIS
jgi:hypothetical protein